MDKQTKEILERFAQRLIDNNARSRSYFVGQLRSSDSIDLYSYTKMFSRGTHLANSIVKHSKLVFPYQAFIPTRINELCDELLLQEGFKKSIFDKELVAVIPNISEKDLNNLFLHLNSPDRFEIIRGIVFKYEESYRNRYLSIDNLLESAKAIERESARNDLYIGYPFIEGTFFSGKSFRAPLLLHSVSIESSPHLKVIKFNNLTYLNPVFVISYIVENKMPHQRFDFDFSDSKEILKTTAKFLKDKLALNLDFSKVGKLVEFVGSTKKNYEENMACYPGEFKLLNNAVIGIFPISSKSIYYDIKNILSSDTVNTTLKNFLSKHHKDTPIIDYFNQNEEQETREDKIEIIGESDITQKMIIKDSINQNIVIQGPPGTGKSQTIVNIIATNIAKGKKVLVVSEKKTAIDVIYNRLEKLADFSLIIRNLDKDKVKFYEQINDTLGIVKKLSEEEETTKSRIYTRNKTINSFFNNIHDYHKVICADYDTYSFEEIASCQKVSVDKDLYRELKSLVSSYESFQAVIEEAFKEDYLNSYLKLKKELESFKTYQILHYNLEAIKRIKKIFALDISLRAKKYLFHRVFYSLPLNNYQVPFKVAIFGYRLSSTLKEMFEIVYSEINNLNFDLFINNQENYQNAGLLNLIFKYKLDKETLSVYYKKILYEEVAKKDKNILKFIQNYPFEASSVDKAINEKQTLCEEIILSRLIKEIIVSSSNNRDIFEGIKELQRLANLKRRKSIAYVLEKTFNSLRTIYPVWLVTPEVASSILPLQTDIFDVLVFDEASQIFLENAAGVIYRSKRVIVVGDTKQLRPSSVFSSRFVEDPDSLDSSKLDKYNVAALEEESLLDYASHKYMQKSLRYHYRSEHKNLIEFSNRAFYNGQLYFTTANNHSYDKPLEVVQVADGLWDNNINVNEAYVVRDLVLKVLLDKNPNDTMGVITFNEQQRKFIEELLLKEVMKNPDEQIRKRLAFELNRYDEAQNEDMSLFIKNIENVQGDERDIIIFSITYAKNKEGKLNTNFGLLSMNAGENRLNVAITRAKKKIIIVKSFYSYELLINENNKGPYYFKKYLEYAEYVHNGRDYEKYILLNSLSIEEKVASSNHSLLFIDDLYNRLSRRIPKNKYYIETNVEIGTFNFDIVIFDSNTKKIVVGIIGDQRLYDDSIFERENSYYSDKYLQNRGWNFIKIFSSNYWKNPTQETKRIIEHLSIEP